MIANDIILVDEIRSGNNAKLEIWWDALESKGFWLSRTKIEYMEYKFSKSRNKKQRGGKTWWPRDTKER